MTSMDLRGLKGCLAAPVLSAGTVHLPADRPPTVPGHAIDMVHTWLIRLAVQSDLLDVVCMLSTMLSGHCNLG